MCQLKKLYNIQYDVNCSEILHEFGLFLIKVVLVIVKILSGFIGNISMKNI